MKNLKVFTDGGCRDNPGPGAWAFVLHLHDGKVANYSGFLPLCTNNQAEYRALEAACVMLLTLDGVSGAQVEFFSDSQLVVEQINGRWKVNDVIKSHYSSALDAFRRLSQICALSLTWMRRELNKDADFLCNQVMDRRGITATPRTGSGR